MTHVSATENRPWSDSDRLAAIGLWILSFLLVSTGVAGFVIVNDVTLWKTFTEPGRLRVALGEVRPKGGTVRVKAFQGLSWDDIRGTKKAVSDGDSVFTSATSSALLVLKEGGEITLAPGTLVVVTAPKDPRARATGARPWQTTSSRPVIEVKQGKIRLASDSQVRLKLKERIVSLSPTSKRTEIELERPPREDAPPIIRSESREPLRFEGVAGLEESPEIEYSPEGTLSTVTDGSNVETDYVLSEFSPADQEHMTGLPVHGRHLLVKLGWRWHEDREPKDSLTLEMDGTETHRSELSSGARSFETLILPGTYRWRLVGTGRGAENFQTPWTTFSADASKGGQALNASKTLIEIQPKKMEFAPRPKAEPAARTAELRRAPPPRVDTLPARVEPEIARAPAALETLTLLSASPSQGERLLLKSGSTKSAAVTVHFRWNWPEGQGAPAADELRLEVEGSASSSLQLPVQATSADLELASGTYRWRLFTGRSATPWRSFTLLGLTPPIAEAPRDQDSAQVADGESYLTRFEWKALAPGLRAELELRSDKAAPKIIEAGSDFTLSRELEVGRTEWRLRSRTEDGEISEWSPPRVFDVKMNPGARATAIQILPSLETGDSAADTSYRSNQNLKSLSATLQWKRVANALQYEVEIFNGKGSRVHRAEVTQPKYAYEIESLDSTLTYQVTARFPDGTSLTSGRTPIRISVLPPLPGQPTEGSSVLMSAPVLVTWTKTCLTDDYLIQIARDASFNQLVVNETQKDNFIEFKPPEAGIYYWRIQSRAHGKSSEWSPTSSFQAN